MASEYDTTCPAGHTVKIGRWVADHSKLFLHDEQDGKTVLNYRKATPVLLSALLLGLELKTADAQEVIGSLPDTHDKRGLVADLDAWKQRLARYQSFNSDAMVATPSDPGSVWWCVTMPLILGWYPNATCTGIDPEQKGQELADVATPILLINAGICAGAFYDTQNLSKYFEFSLGLAEDLAKDGIEGAKNLYEEAKELATKVKEHVEGYLDFQKKALPWIAGAVIVGGLAYLAFTYGPKTRRQ